MDDLADGFFGSSAAISVNTAINMPSFVAPPLTNLCETRYASKKAEEKQCGGRRPGENCSVSIQLGVAQSSFSPQNL